MTEDPRQAAYRESRRRWVEDPENQLIPYPKRRNRKARPEPGCLALQDSEEG